MTESVIEIDDYLHVARRASGEACTMSGPGRWPYTNWHEFVRNGVRPWGRDQLTSEADEAFLAVCRENIEAVLWSVWLAADSGPLPETNPGPSPTHQLWPAAHEAMAALKTMTDHYREIGDHDVADLTAAVYRTLARGVGGSDPHPSTYDIWHCRCGARYPVALHVCPACGTSPTGYGAEAGDG
jgi:hypothetical protein